MAENQSPKGPNKEEEKRDGEETKEEQQRSKVVEVEEILQNSLSSSTEPFDLSSVFTHQNSKSETLVVESSLILAAENDQDSDCPSFSQLLNAAMVSPSVNSTSILSVGCGLDAKPTIPTLPESLDNKEQFGMSHQEVLATIRGQDYKQTQDEYTLSSMDLVPVSITQSTSSTSSLVLPQQTLPAVLVDNNVCKPEIDEQKSFDQKVKPAQVVAKTPTPDGYNWRKYGQKRVKSTESSRSYYRCTYVNCHAKKKIERCDHSSRVCEIIYKGRHNHDPPRKTRCTKGRRSISCAGPGGGSSTIDRPLQKLKNSDPTKSRKETKHGTPKQQLHSTSKCDNNARIKAEEEQGDEPIPKRRKKERNVSYSIPLFKTVKEPKVVVQASGDVGISGDGYRWRKYGQKMVKGNPNPRSYYKCTSAGCPVRKHVERATDDTTAIIITYEGKHDHDMPVPKKRQGPPSAALLIAAAAAMSSSSPQSKISDALSTQEPSTHWSIDMEEAKEKLTGDQKALELGGEKVLESARTLLSIGIELKPY